MAKFFSFARQITACFGVLAVAVYFLSQNFPDYPRLFGILAVSLMALNALAALFPLYAWRKKNPFNVYLWGMLIRLGFLGAIFIALITRTGLPQEKLLAITFTALFSFIVYLSVELRHFLKHPESFQPA